MRVTVLGGCAAGPGPGVGCSGYLVADGAARIVLDLGPSTLQELLKHVKEDEIDGIVLSHMHQDHWLDLVPFRYRLKYGPNPAPGRIALHLPPGGTAMLERVAAALEPETDPEQFFGDVFKIAEYDPSAVLTIASRPIRFASSVHSLPCWMMRVVHPSGDLGYTADTGFNPAAAEFMCEVRCLLVEATSRHPIPSNSHLSAREAGELAAGAHSPETVLCHLWSELGRRNLLRDAKAVYDGRLHLAEPGLTIDWS